MDKKPNAWLHWVLVGLYWLFLLGLIAELGSEDPDIRENPMLPWMILVFIAFGIWRVVRKRRKERSVPLDND